MEVWKIVIPIIVLLVYCIGGYWVFRTLKERNNKRTYICPRTEHKYMPLYRCKLKCPTNGEWFDAIIYQGLDDGGKLYVRERKDFLDKFVKLTEYNNGNNSKQGASEAD